MKLVRRKRILIPVILLICGVLVGIAVAMSGENYDLTWNTGAGTSSGGDMRESSGSPTLYLTDVIGQTAPGSASGTNYHLAGGFLGIMPIRHDEVKVYVSLQGENRPPVGWEVPLTVCFCPEGSDESTLLNPGSEIPCFTGTATAEFIDGGTKATITVGPVYSDTYDITIDSDTALLNVKRSVPIL